ncbi:MAG: hypothetical protein MI922_16515 [Bacteroidales bacterium]|nr:hypothetical protein [Bacteroidales bacterium]
MAQKLIEFYNEADRVGGIKAKMRLAIISKLPSVKAETEPDSPENIAKFEKAMEEIKKEFS